MPTDSLPHWLDTQAVDKALSRVKAPDSAELTDILNKSLALEPLSLQEAAALMRVSDAEELARMTATADEVKQRVYGDRMVLSAPLHISNGCDSECLYCASRRSNATVERRRMGQQEIREAGRKLIRQGHKRVFLVSGQLTHADVSYLVEAVNSLYTVFDGTGEIRCVNVDVGALDAAQYPALFNAYVGSVLIYQDSYHERSYRAAHVAGPKSDFSARLNAPDAARQAGASDLGLGILLGLGPWQYDLLSLCLHAAHLARVYDAGCSTVSMHRLRPAPGCQMEAPYPVSDADYLRCVTITRLAIPYTGIVLTTKEPAGLWRDGCNAGGSQLLTGSVANPYNGWTEVPGQKVPFPASEDCHVDEVVRFLLEDARHLPSFCAACPRLGRIGHDFLGMVQEGGMKSQCGPNSMASFMEFLLNYATPYTRQMGEKLIAEKLENMPEHERGAAERLLQKVKSGRVDEFI